MHEPRYMCVVIHEGGDSHVDRLSWLDICIDMWMAMWIDMWIDMWMDMCG